MKRSYWVAIFVVLVLTLAIVAVKVVLPGLVKAKILEAVERSCADCSLSIKSVDISFSGVVTFHDLRLMQGQAARSLIETRFERLVVTPKLQKDPVIIKSVEGFGPEIIYADGDAPEMKAPEKSAGESLKFEILETKLHDASFRYAHTVRKKTSILRIDKIDAEMSAVGNTPDTRERMTTAKLTGEIEKSGRGQLDLAALVRPGPWYVDATLEIHDQDLAALNHFFTPNDRIEIKGLVEHAIAKVNVRDEMAKASVLAIYRDAGYKELPSEDRSPIEATLANIGSSILMTKTNKDFPKDKQSAEIDVKRDADEPLVHYMLKSAKLGLLEVAKKKK